MNDRQGPTGLDLLNDPTRNKSTAFTEEERERYGLRGLLPPAVSTPAMQQERVLGNLRRKSYDIERYVFLQSLEARNERLFYRIAIDHIEEILPLIYTPTVGQACREYAHIFRRPKGFYVSAADRGRVREMLGHWPQRDIRVIVVTDGERILGLGDLGANGMGIPIGKLALYTACAGIHPAQCLPIMLDVGTNNEELLADPLYLGLRQRRQGGQDYLDLVEELVVAIQDVFPRALLQFEDFLTPNAYRLLNLYRGRILSFNDDIQGTAAVALAGVYASTRLSQVEFRDLRVMFLGAGSAATGIGDLVVQALVDAGVPAEEALERVWFVDGTGLVVKSRDGLAEHKRRFAHDYPQADFVSALRSIRPQVLIGATGRADTFTREAIELMAEINPRPTIFALSNPTSQAECTAEQAYAWSGGRAIFASGSPFPPVSYEGRELRPGQGNNAYVFPGVGLGAVACGARRITDSMFLAAAKTLAAAVTAEDLAAGAVYPSIRRIRELSLSLAVAVAQDAEAQSLATTTVAGNIRETIAAEMYDPEYERP